MFLYCFHSTHSLRPTPRQCTEPISCSLPVFYQTKIIINTDMNFGSFFSPETNEVSAAEVLVESAR